MATLKLSDMQLDALKEVGNIGAAHAATALSQMVDKAIMISVSNLEIISIEDITKTINGSDQNSAVVSMHMLGDVMGGIMLTLNNKDVFVLIDMLKKQHIGTTLEFTEMEESVLKELGSILTFSYLSAIGNLLKLSMIPSVPALKLGKIKDITEGIFSDMAKKFDAAFCIETEFIEKENKIKGYFMLIPETKGLELIIKSLGVADK